MYRKDDMMNIHCFYLILDHISPKKYKGVMADTIKEIDGKEYSLYAFTPEEEVAEYFAHTRKKNIFFEKVLKMDREDYEDFCDENDMYLLEYHTMATKINVGGYYQRSLINVLCTRQESDMVLYKGTEFYSDELLTELHYLFYYILSNELLNEEIRNIIETYINFYTFDDSTEDESMNFDELSIYVRLFSNTLEK